MYELRLFAILSSPRTFSVKVQDRYYKNYAMVLFNAAIRVLRPNKFSCDEKTAANPVFRVRNGPVLLIAWCDYSIGDRSSSAVTSCPTPCDFVSSKVLPLSAQRCSELISNFAHCGRTLQVTFTAEQL